MGRALSDARVIVIAALVISAYVDNERLCALARISALVYVVILIMVNVALMLFGVEVQ